MGQNPRTKIVELANKLDLDPGVDQTDYLTSILPYSGSIVSVTAGTDTVFNVNVGHGLLPGRYVNISGVTTTPTISGIKRVKSVTATSFTIEDKTTSASGTGSFSTALTSFRDIQGCFNIIVDKLNNDATLFFSNYPDSEGTVPYLGVVFSKSTTNGSVTLNVSLPLMEGEITIYKAFNCLVEYNPVFYSDPSAEKQVSQSTLMLENNNITIATIGFASDLSPAFENIEFLEKASGDWGEFQWGNQNWGGVAAPIPLRTYVPRQKQRCRFTRVRFTHNVALEKFSILGMSLTFRTYNVRAYK